MQYSEVIQFIFQAAISAMVWRAINSIDSIKESINELNEQMAVVINNNEHHDKQLDDHGERIKVLEQTK